MKKISIQEGFNINLDAKEGLTKEEICLNWLIKFRKHLLDNKIADFGDIIPSKKDISRLLKISTGTVQNAIKYAEDLGLFVSKQCIGTMIKDDTKADDTFKMVSKKDKVVVEIKKFLINHKYEENEIIPNIMHIAGEIKTSTNTVRLAINELILKGILRKEIYKKDRVLILNSKIKLVEKEKNSATEVKNKNLVKILKENIKKYLIQNYKIGDKIPSNLVFAKMFNVSVRTINSCTKELNKEKIILSRRGNYGSIFLGGGAKENFEKSLFMSKPASTFDFKQNYNYKWENVSESIKTYILKNYEEGDKIPSMKEFAALLNTSTTTVKKAVHNLIKQGILYAQKGKYGGLFIVEMPRKDDSYQWLAVNPDYFEN